MKEPMNRAVLEHKALIRKELRQALAAFGAQERAAASEQLCRRLAQLPVWHAARSILAFVPMATEPDIRPVLLEALGAGRELAFPRFEATAGVYELCRVGLWDELVPGRFGVMEPDAGCPIILRNQLDLILVPGIGFSINGDRLGRGKGYYDRLLSGVSGFRCGVAFDCQIVTSLPVEPHDVRLNGILTPTRWQQI